MYKGEILLATIFRTIPDRCRSVVTPYLPLSYHRQSPYVRGNAVRLYPLELPLTVALPESRPYRLAC